MKTKKTSVRRKRYNYQLAPGVMRFSAARMFSKRQSFKKKKCPPVKRINQNKKKSKTYTKPIGGEKNGENRVILRRKGPKYLHESRLATKKHKHASKKVPLRSSITPGTVLIILAGRHKGKRVVFLKQLEKSGLLLVTGPLKLNSMPLRRIAQAYVIATGFNVDVSKVKIPKHINDKYFRRSNAKKAPKKGDANIFAPTAEEYEVTKQRKVDQKIVDRPILEAIRKHSERKFIFGYLGSRFSLGKNQYPHNMIF